MGRQLSYLVIVLACAAVSFAQTGTLRGQVTDESGGVVPGAKVRLNGPRGLVKTTTADGTGSYSFSGVADGNYTVQASAPQLVQARPLQATLTGGSQILNLVLTVAARSDNVTVQES